MKRISLIASLAAVLMLSACSGTNETVSETETTSQQLNAEASASQTTQAVTEAAKAEAVTQAVTEAAKTEATKPTTTIGQKNALKKALNYLDFMAFSRSGLIQQLEFEQFSHDDAVYAVDHCGADWNEQAAKKAAAYLEFSSFSKQGLIDQLEFEGFTHSEAEYGAEAVEKASSSDNSGSSSSQATMGELNALKKAQSYLDFSAFSRSGLIEQLEFEQFSHDEAVYAVDHCGADWKEQAAKKAAAYLEFSSFSKQELIDQLKFEGFSSSEAEYGVSAVGY